MERKAKQWGRRRRQKEPSDLHIPYAFVHILLTTISWYTGKAGRQTFVNGEKHLWTVAFIKQYRTIKKQHEAHTILWDLNHLNNRKN